MESSVSGVTDRSPEPCGDESINVIEVVEEQRLGGDNFDSQIEGLENVGCNNDTVGHMKDTKNAAEQPTSTILDKLDAENGSIGETMVSNDEGVQMGTVPQVESSSLTHDDRFSRNSIRSQSLGYGFELGDMVWGKVKSHPWWPGHIFSEAFASLSVRRTKRDGQVLVAFFGDSSYGWFDPAELIPFEPHFAEKSQQTTSRNFVKAVEESVDEACRRSALGLTCFCRNPYNFRPTNVPGHVAANVFGYEAGGIYSHNQIRKARDNFQPEQTLLFIKQLAVAPKEATISLHFAKGKATALAYRRAVYQEFDETYAQAFGQKHSRPIAAPPPTIDQSVRAQLSGPLVIAESLSGHRNSTKALKSKEQTKRDRYLTKRRDESGDMGFSQIGQGYSSSSSSAACEVRPSQTAAGDYISQRRDEPPAKAVDQKEDAPPAKDEGASLSFSPSKAVAETGNQMGQARPSIIQEKPDEMTVSKKAGLQKGVLKRLDPQKSDLGEKKKKKRRTDSPGSSDHLLKHTPAGLVGGASAKGESPGRPSQIDGPSQAVPAEESPGRPNQIVAPSRAMPAEGNISELKRALADLKVLALIPSHGRERNRPAITRQIFLRFRSLVFQKSLAVLPPSASGDTEVSETRSSKTPSGETTKIGPPFRPPKPSGRTNDPTRGGKKRAPSELQEDLAVKRAKKVSTVKSAAASASTEKTKAIPETQHTDGKTKGHGGASQRIGAKVVPRVKILPPKRVEEPTFLVLKYSPGTSIPSNAELKARFARFGPMDTSLNRVFYATRTCRILFLYKEDAESAQRFALRNKSIFAQVTLKSNSVAPDSQAADKLGRDPSRAGEDVSVDRVQPIPPMMMPSSAVQLKSCLKKSIGDEGGSQSSSGVRGARVRFNMGETTSSDASGGAQARDPRTNDSPSLQEARPGSSLSSSLSVSKDSHNNKQKVFSTLPSQPPLVSTTPQYSLASRNNPAHVEVPSRSHSQNYNYASMLPPPPPPIQSPLPPPPPRVDISQQMLSLLTRCNDVVTNMKSILGYVPYHPL